jgi:hypothetical protein
MGDLVLKGSTSGQITVTPTAVAGTNTLTLPAKTGNIITSADTGTVTQSMLSTNVAGNGPAFSAKMSTNQTIAHNTVTKIVLNDEIYDTNNCFDPTTNYRFTPNVAGYYFISASVHFSNAAAKNLLMAPYIYKNGSGFFSTQVSVLVGTGGDYCVFANALVYLNGSTNYIELYAYQYDYTSSGSYTINAASTLFTGALVRAG